jgi:hypothetical protein
MLRLCLALILSTCRTAAAAGGLTLARFNNTALRGSGIASFVSSPETVETCAAGGCGAPSSLLLTGQVRPVVAGRYGFQLTLEPALPYPSKEAYAR